MYTDVYVPCPLTPGRSQLLMLYFVKIKIRIKTDEKAKSVVFQKPDETGSIKMYPYKFSISRTCVQATGTVDYNCYT